MMKTAKFMTSINHVNIVKPTECFIGKWQIHLVSNNIKNTHKPLAELTEVLDEA